MARYLLVVSAAGCVRAFFCKLSANIEFNLFATHWRKALPAQRILLESKLLNEKSVRKNLRHIFRREWRGREREGTMGPGEGETNFIFFLQSNNFIPLMVFCYRMCVCVAWRMWATSVEGF